MSLSRSLLCVAALVSLAGCDDVWSDYDIEPPPATATEWLQAPFVQPEKACVDASTVEVPDGAVLEDGQLCAWDYFSGNVPEGMHFNDVSNCGAPLTQGPPWFAKPERVYESPASLLNDEAWVTEAEWARDQIRASGCSCCHASSSVSGNTSGFDVDAPGVWTDTMTNSQLAMSAGMNPMHSLFGEFPAEDNHGFSRELTLWASTDPERLRDFFTNEFERRDGGQEDLDLAQDRFDALFGQVVAETPACVTEFEGVKEDGTVFWNGDAGIRQLWIMEEGTASPAFPPNLDRPEGTIWAVYVNFDGEPIPNDTLRLGEVPADATQRVPETGAPTFVDGRTYKIYATQDVMSGRMLNCTFTWNAPNDG